VTGIIISFIYTILIKYWELYCIWNPYHYTTTFEYHHKIQGFIYSLLRNTSFEELHNKRGYKFFSFSNIFAKKPHETSSCRMIMASSSTNFIEHISYQLQKIIEHQIPIDVGSIFELEKFVVNQNKNLSFHYK